MTASRVAGLETAAFAALLGFVAALQISIAASGILLTFTAGLWIALLAAERGRPAAPPFFLALLAYAAATLVSAAFSLDPVASFVDSREVLLFVVAPIVFRLARGERAQTLATVIVTVGAVTAVWGVVQYGILEYDHLGQRPDGTMGHYMTYSGLLVLTLSLAAARVLFDRRRRLWSGLVMPALLVALAVTLTRSYWVGAGAALKIAVNVMTYAQFAAAATAHDLMAAQGANPALLTEAWRAMGQLGSLTEQYQALVGLRPEQITGDFRESLEALAGIGRKDLALALELGQTRPGTAAVLEALHGAMDAIYNLGEEAR